MKAADVSIDVEAKETLSALHELFRDNFASAVDFSCDKAGLERCDMLIALWLKPFRATPGVLQKLLSKTGVKASGIPRTDAALLRRIGEADLSRLKKLKMPLNGNTAEGVMKLSCAQALIGLHALINLKKAIKEKSAADVASLTHSFNLSVVHIRTGIHAMLNLPAPARAKSEGGFKAYFIKYAEEITSKHGFERPRDFWTFLRKETAGGPLSIGKYHIQATETGLRYREGGPPKNDANKLQKSSILRYFSEAAKRIA